jgi:hypothetical protein
MWVQEVKPGLFYVYKKVGRRNVYVGKSKEGRFVPAEGISAAKEVGARRLLYTHNDLSWDESVAPATAPGVWRRRGDHKTYDVRGNRRMTEDEYSKESRRVNKKGIVTEKKLKRDPQRYHKVAVEGGINYYHDTKENKWYRVEDGVTLHVNLTFDRLAEIRHDRRQEAKERRKRDKQEEKERRGAQRLARDIRRDSAHRAYLQTVAPSIVLHKKTGLYFARNTDDGYESIKKKDAEERIYRDIQRMAPNALRRTARGMTPAERRLFRAHQRDYKAHRQIEQEREEREEKEEQRSRLRRDAGVLKGARKKAYDKVVAAWEKAKIRVSIPEEAFATKEKETEFHKTFNVTPVVMHRSYSPTGIEAVTSKTLHRHPTKEELKTTVNTTLDGNEIEVEMSNKLFSTTRTFTRKSNGTWHVYHGTFFIKSDWQGVGIGKTMFKKWYGLYENMGVKKITVHAAAEEGWKQWAKYGFDWSEPEEMHDQIRRRLKRSGKDEAFIAKHHNLPAYALRQLLNDAEWEDAVGVSWSGVLDLTNAEQRKWAYSYVRYKPKGKKNEKATSARRTRTAAKRRKR